LLIEDVLAVYVAEALAPPNPHNVVLQIGRSVDAWGVLFGLSREISAWFPEDTIPPPRKRRNLECPSHEHLIPAVIELL
jgi:hypothetical protein